MELGRAFSNTSIAMQSLRQRQPMPRYSAVVATLIFGTFSFAAVAQSTIVEQFPPANISTTQSWGIGTGFNCHDPNNPLAQISVPISEMVSGIDSTIAVQFTPPNPIYTSVVEGTYVDQNVAISASPNAVIGSVYTAVISTNALQECPSATQGSAAQVTLTVVPGLASDAQNPDSATYAQLAQIFGTLDEIWWFGGNTVPGYQSQLTITANYPGHGPYTWSLTGDGSVGFASSPSATSVTTSDDSVSVVTTGMPTSSPLTNITVTSIDGFTSSPEHIISLAPYSLAPYANSSFGNGCTNNGNGTCDAIDSTYGYLSYIGYEILDENGYSLPQIGLPLNELFTSGLTNDYANALWRQGLQCGQTGTCGTNFIPNQWADNIGGEALGSQYAVPTPQNPQSPLLTTKVDHWTGEWRIGSPTPGVGVRVQANTWQKYLDHGRHEGITTPDP